MSQAAPRLTRPLDQLRGHSGPAGLDPAAAQAAAGRDRQAAACSTPTKRRSGRRGRRACAWRPTTRRSPPRSAAFGGEVRMTSPDCASGTDRVAEVARQLADVDILVNVQGDEPELPGESIDLVDRAAGSTTRRRSMSTLATPIRRRELLDDPACVKVVFDGRGRALYFSRSPIPHARSGTTSCWRPSRRISISTSGCTPIAASFCCDWPNCRARRWRSSRTSSNCGCWKTGYAIAVGVVDEPTVGIDTPEDYRAFVRRQRSR